MDNTAADTKEQLKHMKAMTVRFGTLHEAQELQLQMWPLVLFKCTASTALVSEEDHKVKFQISINKKPAAKVIQTQKEILQDWVRAIVWDDTEIEIEFLETNHVREKRATSSKRKRR